MRRASPAEGFSQPGLRRRLTCVSRDSDALRSQVRGAGVTASCLGGRGGGGWGGQILQTPCDARASRSLLCVMFQVLVGGAFFPPCDYGKGPAKCLAMEGAGKLLPLLPSLNTDPVAFGVLKCSTGGSLPSRQDRNANHVATDSHQVSVSNLVAFTPRIIFQNGSPGWRNAVLLKGGDRAQQGGGPSTGQRATWRPRAASAPTYTWDSRGLLPTGGSSQGLGACRAKCSYLGDRRSNVAPVWSFCGLRVPVPMRRGGREEEVSGGL